MAWPSSAWAADCGSPTCAESPSCSNPGCGFDTDGDGLNDAWETQGIDLDCDDTLDLPALPGAVVGVKDIYLEWDYMDAGTHSHEPNASSLALVEDAFAAQGIVLHIDPNTADAIPETRVLTFGSPDPNCPIPLPDTVDFYDLKATYFDHAGNPAYHYVIFGHLTTCDSDATCAQPDGTTLCPDGVDNAIEYGATGLAERPGNDVMVTLGWSFDYGMMPPTDSMVAGTLMHELGHNLSLRHGGDADTPERKPNHLSVMNSRLQPGIPFATTPGSTAEAGRRVDFSGATLPPLNEAGGLDESIGIGAGTTDITKYSCPWGTVVSGAGDGSIDWDCNGFRAGTGVSADLNSDLASTSMSGHDDWAALDYDFQCSPAFPAGRPPDAYISRDEVSLPTLYSERLVFPVRTEAIDVDPGSSSNPIDLGSAESLAVALLGAADFDVSLVDVASVRFAGAPPVGTSLSNVNGDGFTDLVAYFQMNSLNLIPSSTEGLLTAALTGTNQGIEGRDSVTIVSSVGPANPWALLALLACLLLGLQAWIRAHHSPRRAPGPR